MDEKKLKRPSSNLNWLWWSLGAFFTLVFTFQLGVWTAGTAVPYSVMHALTIFPAPLIMHGVVVQTWTKYFPTGDKLNIE